MGDVGKGIGDVFSGKMARDLVSGGVDSITGMLNPDLPDPAELPAEVEEVDVAGQKKYTKSKLKSKKGRSSTILGSNNSGLKTVLG
jgi:hypothetical protein